MANVFQSPIGTQKTIRNTDQVRFIEEFQSPIGTQKTKRSKKWQHFYFLVSIPYRYTKNLNDLYKDYMEEECFNPL